MQCKTNVLACNLGESIAMQMTTKSAIKRKTVHKTPSFLKWMASHSQFRAGNENDEVETKVN